MSTASTTSIALCTYNGERFLQAQLDSLLAQTRLPDQIVVFDDASQDGTWAILAAFAQPARQRGIQVLLRRQPANVGYVRNFEAALAECSGEIVFLCDQDDVWHADKIQRMAARFAAEPGLTMLHADARLVDVDGDDLGIGALHAFEVSRAELDAMHADRAFEVLLNRNIVTGATMAMRRRVIERALPVPDVWHHDEWLAMAAALLGHADTDEAELIDYRQHGENQIGVHVRGVGERLAGGSVRRTYMRRIVERTRILLERTDSGSALPMSAGPRARAERRLAHARLRLQLPTQWWLRWKVIGGEMAASGYADFSPGWRPLVSDLVGLR